MIDTSPAARLSADGHSLATHRAAVTALFAVNGFLYATWAARVPMIQQQYGVDDAAFGLVLLAASGGAFMSMPFAAYLTSRLGVRTMTIVTSLLYIGIVALLPHLHTSWLLFPLFALLGVGFGLLDVAMNAQAVEVEKVYDKPIMSSFHAGFSGAMIGGALLGSVVIWLELTFAWHLSIAALTAVGVLMWSQSRLYTQITGQAADVAADQSAFRLPVRATWLIGAIGFCSMMSEASISDWTVKFMREVAGAQPYIAPFSLAAFSATMTVGRVFGDGFRQNFGDAQLLRYGSWVALLGMVVTLVYPTALTTILGATLVGCGLAVAVPIVFSLSGKVPGLTASAAMAMVTTISYVGNFIGPAVIGFLAEAYGLRVGYGFILLVLLVMVVLVRRVK